MTSNHADLNRRPEFAAAESLILEGRYAESLHLLESLEVLESRDQRIMLHLRAQAQIYLGALDDAKSNLLRARRHFGENIAVLRDLACLYYQTGEMIQWRQSYRELQERLEAIGDTLTLQTAIQCGVTVAKFLEEDAYIHQALAQYEQGLEKAVAGGRSDLRLLCLPQITRIKAIYQRTDGLGDLYRELIATQAQQMSFDLYVEIEHSLMLAELELIGLNHAWSRVNGLLSQSILAEADRRLVYFDFVAEALLKALPLSAEMIEVGQQFTDLDAFELEVRSLSLEQGLYRSETLDRLTHLASEMSWSCFLRLLTIHYAAADLYPDTQREIKNRLNLIMSTLDPNSRFFWIGRVKSTIFNDTLALEYSENRRTIAFQGRSVDLSKKKTMMLMLSSLVSQREINVDDLIEKLWQSQYSPENFHRLRMTVHRLNQVIFELSAVPKVIEMTADRVSIRPNIQLTTAG